MFWEKINKCQHKWKVVKIYNYIDISYNEESPSSKLTLQCKLCGDIKTKILYGVGSDLKMEDFNND